MTAPDHADLAGYLLDTQTPAQRRRVEEHLAGCAACRDEVAALREWSAALEALPAELLLDGPPEGGDLLLHRTLRQVRAESSGRRHRRTALLTTAAAAVLAVAVAAGVVAGRGTAPTVPSAQPPVTATAPGTRVAAATDATTGARISVAVLPAAGWVRVTATVTGIPAGRRCRLEVVDRSGVSVLAGGWLVSPDGASHGTTLNGSALIDPAQVASVRVVDTSGTVFTSVAI